MNNKMITGGFDWKTQGEKLQTVENRDNVQAEIYKFIIF